MENFGVEKKTRIHSCLYASTDGSSHNFLKKPGDNLFTIKMYILFQLVTVQEHLN